MAAPTESKNFSSLTALATAPASTDELYIQDVSEAVATDKPKRITFANLTTNLQPLDAGLTDIAALAVTDGNFIVGNGSNWVAESGATAIASLGLDADLATFSVPASTTISAFGATLVDDANAAAAIATLGLDADLATFALPANTTISTFGASLIDDANAAAARTTLGVAAFSGSQQTLAQSGATVSCDATTNENVLGTYTMPANTMGANDIIDIDALWSYTNSANTKTLSLKFGGTAFNSVAVTTSARNQTKAIIRAANSTSSQVGTALAVASPYQAATAAAITAAVDTTAPVTIEVTGTKASAGETLSLLGFSITIRRAP